MHICRYRQTGGGGGRGIGGVKQLKSSLQRRRHIDSAAVSSQRGELW